MSEINRSIEALRAITESIQQAGSYEELEKKAQNAEKIREQLAGSSEERRAETLNLVITEKVSFFLSRQVKEVKKELLISSSEEKKEELKGRLKKYENLADFSGTHKRYLLDEIFELFKKL